MHIVDLILAWPYSPVVAFGIASALVTYAGPALVARFPWLAGVVALLRRVGLDLSAPRTGRDAYELYRAAAGHVSAHATALPDYEALPARQREAWEASVVALAALRPPSEPPDAPSKPPDAPTKSPNGSPPSLPPIHRVLWIAALLFVSTTTGCAGAQEELRSGLEAARDVVAAAEPCMAAEHDREVEACAGDATCTATVRAHWAPIADALDVFHAAWCSLSPSSGGCDAR